MGVAAAATSESQEVSSSANTNSLADLSIEQLMEIPIEKVFGASRYEQKVTQAPASVSIVTADEIKKFGYRTLVDVLRSVRGLYVSDDRNYSYMGVRGFLRPGDYNTRVLVLVDGHRMNDNVYDVAYIAREGNIDVDLIDRVEFVRGPSSSIYGSSAFFGVVNIISKRGSSFDGVEVSGEAGSLNSYKGRFSYGKLFKNDVELLLSGSYYTSEGHRRLYYPEFDQRVSIDPRATNNGVAKNADGEKAFNLSGSVSYHELSFSGFFASRTKEVPTASFGTVFNDGRLETTDYRAYADLKYERSYGEDIRLAGRLFYDHASYYGDYPYNYAAPGDPPDLVLNKDYSLGEWAGTEWQVTSRLFDRHTLLGGLEYRENLHQRLQNYDDRPRFVYLDMDPTSRSLGLFAQAELAIRTNLVLNTGVRYDYYFGSFGGTLNPRVGLIYNPWQTTTFKWLYGQAFRAPNPYERFFFTEQRARPELDPEKIRTYELVYEQYLGRHYRLNVSGFYYEVEDLISQTATPTDDIYFDNLDSASAKGVELELEGRFDSGLMARVSYTLQRAEDGETGRELSSSPRHLAKVNLSVPLYKDKVFAGLELQYQGSVKTINRRTESDFLTANLTLFSHKIVKDLEVSASVYNLFDTEYSYPGAEDHLQDVIQQDGRSFRVKLTYRF